MLPDYPSLKRDFGRAARRSFQASVKRHLGSLGNIPRTRFFEGHQSKLVRETGEVEKLVTHEASAEFSVATKEIPELTVGQLLLKLDEAAVSMAMSLGKNFYEQIGRAAEKVGNKIDGQGRKFTAETVLDALDKVQIDFNADGTPRLPEIHIGSDLEQSAKDAIAQAEESREIKTRFNATIRRKREEWRAREASRSLVG